MTFWPRSLVTRTVLVLVTGLVLTQIIGLSLYSDERRTSLAKSSALHASERIAAAHNALDAAPPAARPAVARTFWGAGLRVTWDEKSRAGDERLSWAVRPVRRALAEALSEHEAIKIHIAERDASASPGTVPNMMPMMGQNGPNSMNMGMMPMMAPMMRAWKSGQVLEVSLSLTDGTWMNALMPFVPPVPFWSTRSFLTILLATGLAGLVSIWAIQRAARPLDILASAADRLGRDVNAPPLPEDGPAEIARAASAFNRMQEKLRAFVHDRTRMLAAISHDLRTPITRLRLRAEMIEESALKEKTLADLDEMETMIASALAYARGVTESEEKTSFDIASLVQDLCETERDGGRDITYEGPARHSFIGQRLGIKRALANLIGNALSYGNAAEVKLEAGADDLTVQIDDGGPGIPESDINRVFDPFFRMEGSRSRETGGAGLGLAIVRAIADAHGGSVNLENRAEGGLRATLRLPRPNV